MIMTSIWKWTRRPIASFGYRSGLLKGALAGTVILMGCPLQARADVRGEMLLQEVRNTLAQTNSLTAAFATQSLYGSRYRDTQEKGTVALSRPGLARIEITRFRKPESADVWKETGNGSTVVADGSRVWTLIRHPHSAQYRPVPATATAPTQLLDNLEPLRGFFSAAEWPVGKATYIGSKQWENATYEVVRIEAVPQESSKPETQGQQRRSSAPNTAAEIYIGQDHFIHRYVVEGTGTHAPLHREISLRHIQKDAALSSTAFTFAPPKNAVEYERAPAGTLLAPGTVAPDFTIEDAAGKPLHLSDLRNKIVVLKFWATWCWSCRLSLPSTNDIAHRYADKDVVVLAVDIWDSRKALQAWLSRRSGVDYLRFGIDPQPQGKDIASTLYNVKTTPTQYVIDKAGKIVAAVEGFDGPDERLEVALRTASENAKQSSAGVALLPKPADTGRTKR